MRYINKVLKWGALSLLAMVVAAGAFIHFFSFPVGEDEMGVWPHPTLPIEAVVTRINPGAMSSYSYKLWIRSDESKSLDEKAVILHTRGIEGTKISWRPKKEDEPQLFIECVRPLVYDSKMTFRIGDQFFAVGMDTDCPTHLTYEWLNVQANTPLSALPPGLHQDPKLRAQLRADGAATRTDYPLTLLLERQGEQTHIELLRVEMPAQ